MAIAIIFCGIVVYTMRHALIADKGEHTWLEFEDFCFAVYLAFCS